MSEVMAFGDYDNDVEMLTAAGLGVVVENGSAAAKASADLIIGACDQNGPAKFLENLMSKTLNKFLFRWVFLYGKKNNQRQNRKRQATYQSGR